MSWISCLDIGGNVPGICALGILIGVLGSPIIPDKSILRRVEDDGGGAAIGPEKSFSL